MRQIKLQTSKNISQIFDPFPTKIKICNSFIESSDALLHSCPLIMAHFTTRSKYMFLNSCMRKR